MCWCGIIWTMSGKDSNKNTSRRNALKLAAGSGAVAVGLPKLVQGGNEEKTNDSIIISGDESTTDHAYVKQEHQYDIQNNNYYRLDSSVNCYGGNPTEDNTYDWVNHFCVLTAGVARRYDPENQQPSEGEWVDILDKHALQYTKDGTGDVVIDLASDGEDDPIGVGGYPTPVQTDLEAVKEGVETAAEIVISDKLKGVAGFIKDAYDIYSAVSSAEDEETVNFGTSQFVWDYGNSSASDQHSDICHVVEFSVRLNYGDSTTVYWDTDVYDNDLKNRVNWKIDLEAPSDNTTTTTTTTDDGGSGGDDGGGDTTTTTDDGGGGCGSSGCLESLERINGMSKQERKRWGLRRVPVEKLRNAGVPVKNLAQFPDGTTWYATSPPVTFSATPKAQRNNK